MAKRDKNSRTLNVRVKEHEYQRIKFASEADNRTMSNFVRYVVMKHLDSFSEALK